MATTARRAASAATTATTTTTTTTTMAVAATKASKQQQRRNRKAMTIVTDDAVPALPSVIVAPAPIAAVAEDGELASSEDTLSELPHLPRRGRAVTQADADEFAKAAEAAESAERRTPGTTPRGAFSPRASLTSAAAASTCTPDVGSVGPSDFELLCVIGQGAFGKARASASSVHRQQTHDWRCG